ncbi:MAG: hypothetical protein ACI9FJ_000617 [Alteromonadaceae bacterium]|jgi:hypothetical protein
MRQKTMKKCIALLAISLSALFCLPANAHSNDQYRITLLRATPGNLGKLLEETRQLRKSKKGDLVIMRHSNGDHWDLMLMDPAGKDPATQMDLATAVDFQHSFLATADQSWQKIRQKAENNSSYHIEMFNALAGKKEALLEQRKMENAYYHGTQRAGNVIFTTTFGSDVDSFTVGFYPDLLAFATMPDLSDEVLEKAAKDAGFTSRSAIGLYLRELILSHNDTLAVNVSD